MPIMKLDNGIDIFYEEFGSGEKYVICTQIGHARYELERFLPKYGFHVFLLTNRGFGRSTHVTENYGEHWYDVFAEDVVAFADKMGIDKFVYSGASHGAGSGWHLVLNHPERVICFFAVVCGPHNIDESKMSVRQQSMRGEVKLVVDAPTDDEAILERRRLNQIANYEDAKANQAPEVQAMGVSYLFVAHDLAVVKHISDVIVVMYMGQVMEVANSNELYRNPMNPYTQALLAAIPVPDPAVEKQRNHILIKGETPSLVNRPAGCPFFQRCPQAMERCKTENPQLREKFETTT